MTIGDASGTRLAYVAEVTQGTTPASPAFSNVRFTGENLKIATDTAISQEIRADGNVPDLIRVGSGVSGGFNWELSYGTLDNFIAALLRTTWSSNVAKNSTATLAPFTLEKTIELGATDSYHRLVGCVPSELNLKIAAGEIITGDMQFMGFGGSLATTAIASSSYAAVNTNVLMNATSDFGSLTMTGIATLPKLLSLTAKMRNNARLQRQVGQLNAIGTGFGQFTVEGSFRAYFEDNNLYQAYLSGTPFVLTYTLGTVTLNKYTIALPVSKIKDAVVVAGGNGQDVVADIQYQGLFDSSSSATLTITRNVA